MSEFKKYKRTLFNELKPYTGEDLAKSVSINNIDLHNGSPKYGDMIARNPNNHSEQWLLSKEYFDEQGFKEVNKPEEKHDSSYEPIDHAMNQLEQINENLQALEQAMHLIAVSNLIPLSVASSADGTFNPETFEKFWNAVLELVYPKESD